MSLKSVIAIFILLIGLPCLAQISVEVVHEYVVLTDRREGEIPRFQNNARLAEFLISKNIHIYDYTGSGNPIVIMTPVEAQRLADVEGISQLWNESRTAETVFHRTAEGIHEYAVLSEKIAGQEPRFRSHLELAQFLRDQGVQPLNKTLTSGILIVAVDVDVAQRLANLEGISQLWARDGSPTAFHGGSLISCRKVRR